MSEEAHTLRRTFTENWREFLFLLILGSLATYLYLNFSSDRDSVTYSPIEERKVLQMQNIIVNDYLGNERKWEMVGKQAFIKEDTTEMEIKEVVVRVLPDNQSTEQREVQLVADESTIDWHVQKITLQGNVDVFRDEDEKLMTQYAEYDVTNEKLTVPGKVTGYLQEKYLAGKNLHYSLSEDRMLLDNISFQQ